MKLITAIVRANKIDAISAALNSIGVTGYTVGEVAGHGMQRGHREVYRGQSVTTTLIEKVRLETLVHDEQLDSVFEAIGTAAKTGSTGDGKLWAVDVADALRVRTGERGAEGI